MSYLSKYIFSTKRFSAVRGVVFGRVFCLLIAAVSCLAPFKIGASEPLSLSFSAMIDRVSGVDETLLPPTLQVGANLTGTIQIDKSTRGPMQAGYDGFEWRRAEDGKPSAHIHFDSKEMGSFGFAWLELIKNPNGKSGINCKPPGMESVVICETTGTISTKDGRKWRGYTLTLLATGDIANDDVDLLGAVEHMKQFTRAGDTKILSVFTNLNNNSERLRFVISVLSID